MFYPKSPFLKCPGIESQLFQRNSLDVEEIFKWLCRTPRHTIYRVNLMKTSPEKIKSSILKVFEARYENPPQICFITDIPEVLCIGPLPLSHIKPFNPSLNEVIVDNSCGAALLRGAHVYGPGVLAMNSGTKLEETVNVFADLEGKCKKGVNSFYESNEKVFIGTGKVKKQRYQLYGKDVDSRGIAIEMLEVISGVPSIGDLSSNEILLQNFPSIICCKVLDPKPGELILDMCAAPGNKTSHIFELTKGEGKIIALDKIGSKIERLKAKILENNWNNIFAFCFDSTKCLDQDKLDNSLESILKGPPFAIETFDRILLDAPCSALGNRPLLISKINQKILQSYPAIQKKLFAQAVGLLKNGGTLVYSTCTIHVDENEGIVAWAKQKFPELKLISTEPFYGDIAMDSSGLLSGEERNLMQRFSVNNRNDEIDTIGFFIAKFVKIF